MAYPTVVMDFTVSRELRAIESSWSTPQLLDALLLALKGDGPALSTSRIFVAGVDPKIALVVTTSGSTGAPKSVALTAKSLITNARATHKYLGAKIGQRWSLLLPTNHVAGINVLVRAIELGTTPVGIESKADFTAIVPTQLHRAVNDDTELLEHLKACSAVLVGGGPLDEALRVKAESLGIRIIATYGATETCGGVIYDRVPLEGIEVSIIDGLIAIKGPQLAYGYLNGELPIKDGWFITSDLGEIVDGKLKVIGRSDDQIISGGEKISLSAIELFLQNEFESPEIIAFAKSDAEWGEKLCIATTQDLSLELLSNKLKSKFGGYAAPKELIRVNEIPYLALGKPDRKRLANDYE
ncbi:MAG: AMP-binding protein [Candidatus Nanopelagicaceae bacterium]|nr:AMP-binding protein [Candidatus Nanopelagicaceae bacterium]